VSLVEDEAAVLGDMSDQSRAIRRFEVFVEGGALRITQIEMLRQTT
jgi:hypothetical protein